MGSKLPDVTLVLGSPRCRLPAVVGMGGCHIIYHSSHCLAPPSRGRYPRVRLSHWQLRYPPGVVALCTLWPSTSDSTPTATVARWWNNVLRFTSPPPLHFQLHGMNLSFLSPSGVEVSAAASSFHFKPVLHYQGIEQLNQVPCSTGIREAGGLPTQMESEPFPLHGWGASRGGRCKVHTSRQERPCVTQSRPPSPFLCVDPSLCLPMQHRFSRFRAAKRPHALFLKQTNAEKEKVFAPREFQILIGLPWYTCGLRHARMEEQEV